MLLLGALFVIAAAAATFIGITQNDGIVGLHAFGQTWQWQAYWLFIAGLVTMAVAAIGFTLIRESGVRSHRAARRAVTAVDNRRVVDTTNDGEYYPAEDRARHDAEAARAAEDDASTPRGWRRGLHRPA